MIDIHSLIHSPHGTRDPFEWELPAMHFKDLPLTRDVQVQGELLRVDEGVLMILEAVEAEQHFDCVRCGKALSLPVQIEGGEWLFYERKPKDFDAENEIMTIDRRHMQLDPCLALRQEILLHTNENPHCREECVEFKEPEKGKKALAGLKDMWEDANS